MNDKIFNNYERACDDIVSEFCKKQDIEFYGWIADEVGGVAGFAHDYFFNVCDLILDLKTNQPKGLILEWQNDSTDFNVLKREEERKFINYKSYTMGIRFIHLRTKP